MISSQHLEVAIGYDHIYGFINICISMHYGSYGSYIWIIWIHINMYTCIYIYKFNARKIDAFQRYFFRAQERMPWPHKTRLWVTEVVSNVSDEVN